MTSLDGKKPVFHAARALGQNPGIANLVILVMLVQPANEPKRRTQESRRLSTPERILQLSVM